MPSPARSGTSVIVPAPAAREVSGQRQVAVGDDEVVEALAGDRRPARLDGAVEAEPGLHSTSAPTASAQAATASSSHATNTGGGRAAATTRSASQRARRDPLVRVEQPGEAALGEPEALHRDQDGSLHGGQDHGSIAPTLAARGDDRCGGSAMAGDVTAAGARRTAGRQRRARLARRRRRSLARPADRHRRAPSPRRRRGRLRDHACASPAATRSSASGPSPTAVGARSSRCTTTRRCRSPSPSPAATSLTNRPPADVPIEGATLPAGAVALPVGHRATITVGLAHAGAGPSSLPAGLPTDDAVVRGWITRTDVASRLDLPEPTLVEAVRAARCELLLAGVADPETEPERHLLGVGELVRLGDLDTNGAVEAVPDVAAAVGATARRGHDLAAAALDRRRRRTRRGGGDPSARRPRATTPGFDEGWWPRRRPSSASDDVALIPMVERRLVDGSTLFPGGIPTVWRGTSFEAHRLVAGPDSRAVAGRALARRRRGGAVGDPRQADSALDESRWAAVVDRRTRVARRCGASRRAETARDGGATALCIHFADERRRQSRLACGIYWEGEGGHRIERDADWSSARARRADRQPRRRRRRQRSVVPARRRAGHRQDAPRPGPRRGGRPPPVRGGVGTLLGRGRSTGVLAVDASAARRSARA